jgi:hypothetical protein
MINVNQESDILKFSFYKDVVDYFECILVKGQFARIIMT